MPNFIDDFTVHRKIRLLLHAYCICIDFKVIQGCACHCKIFIIQNHNYKLIENHLNIAYFQMCQGLSAQGERHNFLRSYFEDAIN